LLAPIIRLPDTSGEAEGEFSASIDSIDSILLRRSHDAEVGRR
jgi:hypothetical protein